MHKKTPLLDALENVLNQEKLSMHVPGHKRNPRYGRSASYMYQKDILGFDFTEIAGLDDLHAPSGAVGEAQQLAANLFNTRKTYFLVNGSSVGIHGAIMGSLKEGDTVAVPRNMHRAVFEGLILSGANPLYYPPVFDENGLIPLGPSSVHVERIIDRYKPQSLILINPTYHGIAADLDLVGRSHEQGVRVIVDEAHGAHFQFDSRLPDSAVDAGADILVHSAHKNLGSLTQTALLHICEDNERLISNVERCLSLLQTTSPSYILMASLDAVRSDMALMGKDLVGEAVDMAESIRDEIDRIPGMSTFSLKNAGKIDLTKIMLLCEFMNGFNMGAVLRNDYGIYAELEEESFVLLSVNVGDTREGIGYLIESLRRFSQIYSGSGQEIGREIHGYGDDLNIYTQFPTMDLTPRQTLKYNPRETRLSDSIGEICGSLVVPYPPGVPVICPGERITREIAEFISILCSKGKHIQGITKREDTNLINILEC